jgi:hypothetical protein
VSQYKTNPLDKDTDKGSKEDGKEVAEKSDPLDPKDDVTCVMTEGAKFTLEESSSIPPKPPSSQLLFRFWNKPSQLCNPIPPKKVRIVGHTDNVGSAASNLTRFPPARRIGDELAD